MKRLKRDCGRPPGSGVASVIATPPLGPLRLTLQKPGFETGHGAFDTESEPLVKAGAEDAGCSNLEVRIASAVSLDAAQPAARRPPAAFPKPLGRGARDNAVTGYRGVPSAPVPA
jgi:hypothetical protein